MKRKDQKNFPKSFVLFYFTFVPDWLITFKFLLYKACILEKSTIIISNNFSLIHKEDQVFSPFLSKPVFATSIITHNE